METKGLHFNSRTFVCHILNFPAQLSLLIFFYIKQCLNNANTKLKLNGLIIEILSETSYAANPISSE